MYSHRFIAYDPGWGGGCLDWGLLFKFSKCLIKYHSVVVAAAPRRLQLGSTLFKSSSCLFMHFVALCILHCWTKAHTRLHICMYVCICTYICIVYGCSYIHSFMKVPAPVSPLLSNKVGLTFSWCLSESSSICYA